MTLLLTCQEVCKTIGPRTLFANLSFIVGRGDRLGIIGANGLGKTTLLRLLCGLEPADSGRITLGGNILVGYLSQDDTLNDQLSPRQIMVERLAGLRLTETERRRRVETMLSRAEFNRNDVPVHTLSGGWRKRLAICLALLHEPDLLLMDEPTNHLDLEGIFWLEKLLAGWVQGSQAALVMVSHDRLFLENCATRIIELSPLYPTGMLQTTGGYNASFRARERFAAGQRNLESRLGNRLRRETEWLQRGPKARTTKAKHRIVEAGRLRSEFTSVRERNSARRNIDIEFDDTGRRTRKLLEARRITGAYGGKVLFRDLDLVLGPATRLGLLGPNGCGKSTLMRMLAAGLAPGPMPDNGTIRTATGLRIAYFAQDRRILDHDATLRQVLSPEGDSVVYRGEKLHVVTWARKFLFRPDQLDAPVWSLSGGEQARILIAGLMKQPADILLLDEPTNDLDIPALQVLEESLLDFPGAVVLVSHDRYLLTRVCTRFLAFSGGGEVSFFPSHEQWRASLENRSKRCGPMPSPQGKQKRTGKQPGRLSYLDQREYDGMEERISRAEAEEHALRQTMQRPEVVSDAPQLEACWRRLEAIRADIDRLYRRWDDLETIRNSLTN